MTTSEWHSGASSDGLIHSPATFNYNYQVYAPTAQLEKLDLKPDILGG